MPDEGEEEPSAWQTDNHESRGTPVTKPSHTSNTVEELRQYKKLLDEGVITQEEYNTKKKKLLEK